MTVMTTAADTGAADIDAAMKAGDHAALVSALVRTAREAQAALAMSSFDQRKAGLHAAAGLIREHEAEILARNEADVARAFLLLDWDGSGAVDRHELMRHVAVELTALLRPVAGEPETFRCCLPGRLEEVLDHLYDQALSNPIGAARPLSSPLAPRFCHQGYFKKTRCIL